MEKEIVKSLVEECYGDFKQINNNFIGYEKINMAEKEEKFYKAKFKELNVNTKIVSEIYTQATLSGNKNELEEIKKNIEEYLN